MVKAKALEGDFAQFAVANRKPFASIRTSQINAPDSTVLGGSADASIIREAPDLDWENRAKIAYQRLSIATNPTTKPASKTTRSSSLASSA